VRCRAGRGAQEGTASVVLPMVLWIATLLAIVTIDLGAYLVAAARAQALADAAALAAVSADIVDRRGPGAPRAEAERVVRAGHGRLEHCACLSGSEVASTAVSVTVPGLVIPRLGAARVTAEASAVLAPPPDLPPGPELPRAPWIGAP
jgi:Flp pilus assembly protein TadG